jgi:hypothetical protein
MPDKEIFRCSDDHLYTASWVKASLLSLHLGVGKHVQRCPVDHHWRTARRVNANDLTDEQIAEAKDHTF